MCAARADTTSDGRWESPGNSRTKRLWESLVRPGGIMILLSGIVVASNNGWLMENARKLSWNLRAVAHVHRGG
jgi:hypothetical protein